MSAGVPRALARVFNHEELRQAAKRRLPRVLFDFIDGAAEDELTRKANRAAFEAVHFLPKVGVVAPAYDLSTTLLGEPLAFPVMIAPSGNARMIHPDGAKALARSALKAGIGYMVPHMGGHSLEEVFEAADPATASHSEAIGQKEKLLWYQIYNVGGRSVAEPAVQRAWKAGYRVLVVTMENGATIHERVLRAGLGALTGGNIFAKLPYLPQLFARPCWLASYLLSGWRLTFPNTIKDGRALTPADLGRHSGKPGTTFAWEDLVWLKQNWPGKIVIKGILRADDAKRAVKLGASAIVVSNHGGRTLDGSAATLAVLPDIVEAVNGEAEIILDSGIRRGRDVIAALAMGARAVLWGRPSMFALAFGEAGVDYALGMLKNEFLRGLVALGCPSARELDSSFLR